MISMRFLPFISVVVGVALGASRALREGGRGLRADALAELAFQDLAVVALRQIGEEMIGARPLKARDVLKAERIELGFADALSRAGYDAGDHLFDEIAVRPADDRG